MQLGHPYRSPEKNRLLEECGALESKNERHLGELLPRHAARMFPGGPGRWVEGAVVRICEEVCGCGERRRTRTASDETLK